MRPLISAEEAAHQLTLMQFGKNRAWTETALLLDAVEFHGLWSKSAKSFSEWLRLFSKQLGKKEGSLWRYLTAGRYYATLQEKLSSQGIESPSITRLHPKVGAESLEILSKLERVAPTSLLTKISIELLDGQVSRTDLRNTWETFRPVLQGRTARGRTDAPSFNYRDNSQLKAWITAISIQFLKNSHAIWLPKKLSDSYLVLSDVSVYPSRNHMFDAVIALKLNRHEVDAELVLHGIKIADTDLTKTINAIKTLVTYCDVMWISICLNNMDELIKRLHEISANVGILVIGDKGVIDVHRAGIQSLEVGVNSGILARILMLKFLH